MVAVRKKEVPLVEPLSYTEIEKWEAHRACMLKGADKPFASIATAQKTHIQIELEHTHEAENWKRSLLEEIMSCWKPSR